MKKVIIRAPALSMSGYGEQARFVLKALQLNQHKFDVFIEDINWGKSGSIISDKHDIRWIKSRIFARDSYHEQCKKENIEPLYDLSIQVTIPNEWKKMATLNIGHTAGIECDRVTPEWIYYGNQVDKIITISEHSKNIYKDTAYEIRNETKNQVQELRLQTPISSVKYAARCINESENFNLELTTDFNFLSVSQMGPRKNTDKMVEWFVEEFHDDPDVGLVLKAFRQNCSHMDSLETENIVKSILEKYPERKCKIYLLHGEMSSEEMCSLYKHPKIKSYVTFTHGEGFGLPIFEAVCNGLPVIAPNWSGHIDYLYAKTKRKKKESIKAYFCKVPFTLKQVNKDAIFPGVIGQESRWCFVEEAEARKCMRKVKNNHSMYLSWAKKLQKEVLTNFTEENQYSKLIEEIESVFLDSSGPEVIVL